MAIHSVLPTLHAPMEKHLSIKSNRGSTLLAALILMGILLTTALGVSELLVGTLQESRLLLEKTQAWYSAESGIEQALLTISEHSPGFDTREEKEIGRSRSIYQINATARRIPEEQFGKVGYAELKFNESVVIPLFRTTEKGETDPARHFRVDYYLNPEIQKAGGVTYSNLDILRWKIFGIAESGPRQGTMEVINEFLPMEEAQNTEENPTCLGNSLARNDCWNGAKFFKFNPETTEYIPIEKFPIETFLREHTQNFLVLTNIVNTDLISAPNISQRQKKLLATIHYRVIEEDGDEISRLTVPQITINADGFLGTTKQSLDVVVKRETFLPVLNFALYRTIMGE